MTKHIHHVTTISAQSMQRMHAHMEFVAAKDAFLSGDSHKLAEFVRTYALSPEQSEFVALALSGEVKIKDGRSETHWTRNLYIDYLAIKTTDFWRKVFFGNKVRVSDEDIFKTLTDLRGYGSSETVKKAISRLKKRYKNKSIFGPVFHGVNLKHLNIQGPRVLAVGRIPQASKLGTQSKINVPDSEDTDS